MKDIKLKDIVVYGMYFFSFIFLIFQDAIYTPDTASYLNAAIYRYPVYPIFTNFLKFVFQDYFDLVTVGIQLLLGLVAVHFTAKKFTEVFQLNYLSKVLIVIILLFPFFGPLYIANNICSEGLSYPFYLFFLTFALDFLNRNHRKSFILLLISYVLLTLTRGQFIILPIIVAVMYILKNKASVFKIIHLKKFVLLLLIPFITTVMDKSYHILKDGKFVSTPFSFISASGAALYVSKASDIQFIVTDDDKEIFKDCHAFLTENNWLLSSKNRATPKEDYKHFHNNVSKLCNYTLHDRGTQYYLDKGYNIVDARIAIEKTSKNIYPILVKNNFKNWIKLYYSNLTHSFKSEFLLFFIVFVFFFSCIKSILSDNKLYVYLFFLASLILSNAMIVAFASHSIIRYLFYNYFLFFIIIVLIFKLIKHGKKA
ncbi:hypothetical protein [Xanthomarina sp. GH4-25]|uniref:hypothetical protein n=1 Tax=Xanthomarina sp. GH4-25 TaxID=3349335 RepID=UPI000D67D23C|nr:hypothetical protein DI383_01305 [Flavobacteriaceae bacterium LYZ1037]